MSALAQQGVLLNWHRRQEHAVLGFGHAGANSATLQILLPRLPQDLGLAEMVMPGRGRRFAESPHTSVDRVCGEALAQLRQCPHAPILFGYSLGALLAYETACRLQQVGRPPRALIVCALDAPHRLPPGRDVHRYSLGQLRTHLMQMGGTPPALLQDLSTLACFAPAIQSDYALIETYQFAQSITLSCPLIVMAGRQDDHTSAAGIAAWQELSSGPFHPFWLDAGHFFMQSHAETWTECFKLAVASVPTV